MKSTKYNCLRQTITHSLKLTFKEPSDLGLTTLLWEIITKLRLIQLSIRLRLIWTFWTTFWTSMQKIKLPWSKIKFRSSHGRYSIKKTFWKISQNLRENTCVGVPDLQLYWKETGVFLYILQSFYSTGWFFKWNILIECNKYSSHYISKKHFQISFWVLVFAKYVRI